MLIYFTTDVHGSEVCFRKFLNSYAVYEPDAMIIGGDITGKSLVPLVVGSDGRFRAPGRREDVELEGEDAILAYERRVADRGGYTWRFTEEDYASLKDRPEELNRVFQQAILDRVDGWMRLAEERLKDVKARVLVSAGNDDIWEVDEVLGSSSRVECPDRQVIDLDDVELVSCGVANETPWNCPRDVPEEELEGLLEELIPSVSQENVIFNFHAPPYESGLDSGPLLGPDYQPKLGMGGQEMVPVGSKAVRAAIEHHQPLLSLHGHIHESAGSRQMGRTLAINPGSEYSEGLLRGALIEIRGGRVKRHQLTCG